ncbi:MAG: sensor histidine kinase [Muribaculaceae bacterium]
MANIYDIRRYGKWLFLTIAAAVVVIFLYVSNNMVRDLASSERERMQIWADATKEIVKQLDNEADNPDIPGADIDFLLRIIEGNTTIPVLLTDDAGNILNYRNFTLPEPVDSLNPMELSETNRAFLADRLEDLSHTSNKIDIVIAEGLQQHLYYEDSTLLKRLSLFPYIQLLVMIVFLLVVYFAVLNTKKAEQNKVWVGLSKETAHQLGTPISSLMAWMELLPEMGIDRDTVAEMDKDVRRLSTIASRFSKIGSRPQLEAGDAGETVRRATSYMATRISPRIQFNTTFTDRPLPAMVSAPLFEWVMENLIKNAVDAMEGHGTLSVETLRDGNNAIIEVTDTGKGIARKNQKTVFNPGFTTKKRGWGLGLTLAKRIIEQYHHGRIFVKTSTPGVGTTFRIEIPLLRPHKDLPAPK